LQGGPLARTLLTPAPVAALLPAPPRTKIKVRLETSHGEWVERIPAWIKWATQVRPPARGGAEGRSAWARAGRARAAALQVARRAATRPSQTPPPPTPRPSLPSTLLPPTPPIHAPPGVE
jgi:hypothetical protein